LTSDNTVDNGVVEITHGVDVIQGLKVSFRSKNVRFKIPAVYPLFLFYHHQSVGYAIAILDSANSLRGFAFPSTSTN